MFSDFEELVDDLEVGTTDLCCFDNYDDITTKYVEFETTGNPVVGAEEVFVSSHCNCMEQRHLIMYGTSMLFLSE